MRIIFALLSLVIGLALIFGGYRLARILIPLWGFLAGLSLGGAVISDMANTPFLGTVLGVAVGLAAGIVFALLAYLYYSLAVLVLAVSLGYWAGSGFMMFLGFNAGLISTLTGIAAGVVVGLAAIAFNAPKYVLIVISSVSGAITAVGGLLLLFNSIPLDAFSYAAAKVSVSNSFFWTVVALAAAIIGVIAQVRSSSRYEFEEWNYWSDHTTHLPPTTHMPAAH